jgi:hypothetical protein
VLHKNDHVEILSGYIVMSLIPGLVNDAVEHHIFKSMDPLKIHTLRTVSKAWNQSLMMFLTVMFSSDQVRFYEGSDQEHIAYRNAIAHSNGLKHGNINNMVIALNADRSHFPISNPYVVLDHLSVDGIQCLKIIEPYINVEICDIFPKKRYMTKYAKATLRGWTFYEWIKPNNICYYSRLIYYHTDNTDDATTILIAAEEDPNMYT